MGNLPSTRSQAEQQNVLQTQTDLKIKFMVDEEFELVIVETVREVIAQEMETTFTEAGEMRQVALDKLSPHGTYKYSRSVTVKPILGAQPCGTMKHKIMCYPRLPGYSKYNTILITYHFPSGIQGNNHPRPGKPYSGTTCTVYLPHSKEGCNVLKLLRKAFDTGLLFTIVMCRSFTIFWKVTWNDAIERKENTHGGRTACGYPDETYLKRVEENLKGIGVTDEVEQ